MKKQKIKGAVDILLIIPDNEPSMQSEADFLEFAGQGYKFLCRLSEMDEEQAENLVPFYPISPRSNFVGHPVYTRKGALTNRATKSFKSLLEANVFNPETTLVFIKE